MSQVNPEELSSSSVTPVQTIYQPQSSISQQDPSVPDNGYPAVPPDSYSSPNSKCPPVPPLYEEIYLQSIDYNSTQDTQSVEDAVVKNIDFSDASIRRSFSRKVYALLFLQLAVTLAVICWFRYEINTREFVQSNIALFYASLVILIVTVFCLICCGQLRRTVPANYILLAIFTLVISFFLGCIASLLEADALAISVGITAVVCLALTIFAFQTKIDFTVCSGTLFISLIILIVCGIFYGAVRNYGLQLIYASVGTLIYSIFMIYDTQRIIGGIHRYSISPEEYIYAALTLYLDVIVIFWYILYFFYQLGVNSFFIFVFFILCIYWFIKLDDKIK